MARPTRAEAVKEIQVTIAPLLRGSGWRRIVGLDATGVRSEVVTLCAYKDGEPRALAGFVVGDVLAYTPDGIIEDAFGGGASSVEWDAMPLEDLKLILAEAKRAVAAGLLD